MTSSVFLKSFNPIDLEEPRFQTIASFLLEGIDCGPRLVLAFAAKASQCSFILWMLVMFI